MNNNPDSTAINYKTSGRVRRNLLAIAAIFGGLISLSVSYENPVITFFCFSTGVAWFLQALCFKFSKISLDKLYISSFAILSFQFFTTELLALVLSGYDDYAFHVESHHTSLNLVIFILLCFVFFERARATKLGFIGILATIVIYTYCALILQLTSIVTIIEPLTYTIISLFLVKTLSLFRVDATSAKIDAELYEKLAFFDDLTGIANRRKLIEVLNHEIAIAQRYNQPLSIIIFDVDLFKRVNDSYGHNIGDSVLKSVAQSVKDVIRSTDYCGRWGGEEFLCILPNTNLIGCYEMAERLRIHIATTVTQNGPQVTASFGIGKYLESDDFDSFIHRVDNALYDAKEQGRNCCLPNPLLQKQLELANTPQPNLKLN